MKITPFICQISTAQNDIYKALEGLSGQCDSKQWPMAGVELGRIIELANRISATALLARDALWDESTMETR